jgi:hypothetical protein
MPKAASTIMKASSLGGLQALAFKAIRRLYPEYQIWRGTDFKYEYTNDVLAIDVINGGPVACANGSTMRLPCRLTLTSTAKADEDSWGEERQRYLLY